MSIPNDIPTVITRERFRELVDPLLAALNLRAEDIKAGEFDSDGFRLTVFERDAEGSRFRVHGGRVATQTVCVHIAHEVVQA